MIAQVTQFLRPNGHRVTRKVEIPDEYLPQYKLIHSCGCELTCEQLRTGQAVQYITPVFHDADFTIEITTEGDYTAAEEALCKMIKEFDKVKFETWLEGLIIAEGELNVTK